jgi:hypothetical protein
MRSLIRATLLASILGTAALIATPAHAQRTGDHIVPSIETVCDGDPYSFGLCNAYCEALDCNSPTPLGTPRACSNLLRNYQKKSGGKLPPCACPCAFNLEADIAALEASAESEIGITIDEATFETTCGSFGPNGETAFVFDATNDAGVGETSEGVRLFYWLDEETCNELGGGLDEPGAISSVIVPFEDNFDYDPPFIDRTGIPLGEGEADACAAALEFLCSQTE